MCSFTIQGRSFIIGGEKNSVAGDNRYRNFEVKQGRVQELDRLQFPFNEGRCTTFGTPYPRVLACGGACQTFFAPLNLGQFCIFFEAYVVSLSTSVVGPVWSKKINQLFFRI